MNLFNCGQCPFAVASTDFQGYWCTARHSHANQLVWAGEKATDECKVELQKFVNGDDYKDDHHLNDEISHPLGNRKQIKELRREREEAQQQQAEDLESIYVAVLDSQTNHSQTQNIPDLNLWLKSYDCELQPTGKAINDSKLFHLRSVEGDLIAIIWVGNMINVSVLLPIRYHYKGNDFLVTVGQVAKSYKDWRDQILS